MTSDPILFPEHQEVVPRLNEHGDCVGLIPVLPVEEQLELPL